LRPRPDRDGLARAAERLAAAQRPLVLAGGGVHLSGAAEVLQDFAVQHNIPVAHTMSGKGAIACTSPLNAGLFGRYDRIANGLIKESDCLLAIGCKFGEIATKRYQLPPAGTPLIHLDIVAEEIGRTVAPTLALWSDAREGLRDLDENLADAGLGQRLADYAAEVSQRMAAWWESVSDRVNSDETPVHMARLMNELNRGLPANASLVADGGFAGHWGGLLYDTKQPSRGFVPDRGFASIGYGLPGAMGADLAAREGDGGPVVGLTGDGGFNMVLGELETARRLELGLTVIVVNNAASGYVKALQHALYGEGAYQSSDLSGTNYAAVAEAMGCHGIRVSDPAELAGALQAGLAERRRPTVLDVVVTRDPARMLPAVDNRAVTVEKGDRIA
jgi:acetolactate synthase-1/2/3 large subunit